MHSENRPGKSGEVLGMLDLFWSGYLIYYLIGIALMIYGFAPFRDAYKARRCDVSDRGIT